VQRGKGKVEKGRSGKGNVLLPERVRKKNREIGGGERLGARTTQDGVFLTMSRRGQDGCLNSSRWP